MLTISSCGCGLAFTDPDALVVQADIDTLKAFEKFLNELLKEPVIDLSTGKPAPFARYKYVVVNDQTSTYGYGRSYSSPIASVSGGTWNRIGEAAAKGGCIYDHGHYMLPGRTEPVVGGGSNPFIWTDVYYFQDTALFKDVDPIYFEDSLIGGRNYVGRPHELLVSTQQAIKCLQEKMAAQAEGREVEEGRAAPAADYQLGLQIPKWAWLAGGAVLLLGAGTAAALAIRGRKGKAVGAWEEDYDDEEEYLSPWEEQVEAFQHLHPQAPGCQREYDMADDLMKAYRKAGLYCQDIPALNKAVEAAWEGKCKVSRKLIKKAHCDRYPAEWGRRG